MRDMTRASLIGDSNSRFRTFRSAVAALRNVILGDFATEYEVYEGFARIPRGGGAKGEWIHVTPSHFVNAAWKRVTSKGATTWITHVLGMGHPC